MKVITVCYSQISARICESILVQILTGRVARIQVDQSKRKMQTYQSTDSHRNL